MAKTYPSINDSLAAFMVSQPVFFVATGADEGRINLSPKGVEGTFRVLGPNSVAFLNLTGSGNETAAHLRRDGRITLMFCSFDARPQVLKLYGHGRAVHQRDAEWADLVGLFAEHPGRRQIVVVDVTEAITSCGFGVPLMTLEGQRPTLREWTERKGTEGIDAYWREHNQVSVDGYPTGLLDDA